MHEIDLIPLDYLELRKKQRWVVLTMLVVAATLAVNLGGMGLLQYLNKNVDAKLMVLRSEKEVSVRQQSRLSYLNAERDELKGKLDLLTGLRGGTAIKYLFLAVDRAMGDSGIVFHDWQFKRAGVVVKANSTRQSNGYFIVLPKKQDARGEETWQINTHMNIKGEAADHSALSSFVSRLIDQDAIGDVRVLRTGMTRGQKASGVEFELAIIVNGNSEDK